MNSFRPKHGNAAKQSESLQCLSIEGAQQHFVIALKMVLSVDLGTVSFCIFLQVKKNVHVVLAFSPVGDSFRNRIRLRSDCFRKLFVEWFLAKVCCMTVIAGFNRL